MYVNTTGLLDGSLFISGLGPDVTAPTITSSNTGSVAENSVLAFTLTANEAVTWTITGGADSADFEISGSTLRWAGNVTRDYESPADADTDNAYVVEVTATDAALNASSQTVTITVTDVDEVDPTITSSSSVSVDENTQLSHTLTADEAVTWSIDGGADQAQFEISGSTLRFTSNGTKDYESPTDSNADNVYIVSVLATDGSGNFASQVISVTVQNVAEGGGTAGEAIGLLLALTKAA
jgi:hypothetical protein